MIKCNIDEEIKTLIVNVDKTIEIDKALRIGNRLYKLKTLREALVNYNEK